MVELASGIDALYLSGRCALRPALLESLEYARVGADERSAPTPFMFGGYGCWLQPKSLGKYRYWLEHPLAAIGITASENLPAFRVQARAEALHSIGAAAVVRWFTGAASNEDLTPSLTVSRLDLHSDWQGWNLNGDDRHRFVCRSRSLSTYEEDLTLTGFSFGNRRSKTITARIYDKTREIAGNGHDWWMEKWGDEFDKEHQVLRVEFEFARQALGQMGISTPDDALRQTDRLWAYATQQWLTQRDPSDHQRAARWPVAAEWEQIQCSSLASSALPIERIYAGRSSGDLRLIRPQLNGWMTTFGAITGHDDIDVACDVLKDHLRVYEHQTQRSFCDRVRERRLKR